MREEGLGCIVLSDAEQFDSAELELPAAECAAVREGADPTTHPTATAHTADVVSDEDFAIFGGLLCSCSRIFPP